jgi:hypothetical protein
MLEAVFTEPRLESTRGGESLKDSLTKRQTCHVDATSGSCKQQVHHSTLSMTTIIARRSSGHATLVARGSPIETEDRKAFTLPTGMVKSTTTHVTEKSGDIFTSAERDWLQDECYNVVDISEVVSEETVTYKDVDDSLEFLRGRYGIYHHQLTNKCAPLPRAKAGVPKPKRRTLDPLKPDVERHSSAVKNRRTKQQQRLNKLCFTTSECGRKHLPLPKITLTCKGGCYNAIVSTQPADKAGIWTGKCIITGFSNPDTARVAAHAAIRAILKVILPIAKSGGVP